jgi:hypothetical protein
MTNPWNGQFVSNLTNSVFDRAVLREKTIGSANYNAGQSLSEDQFIQTLAELGIALTPAQKDKLDAVYPLDAIPLKSYSYNGVNEYKGGLEAVVKRVFDADGNGILDAGVVQLLNK